MLVRLVVVIVTKERFNFEYFWGFAMLDEMVVVNLLMTLY